MIAQLLSSIPSPGDWGRQYRLYGIMIALGVVAALELARRRWAARGGDPEDMSAIALWAVPAGLIGARLYHVITDNDKYRGEHWIEAFQIWKGGLGIPGGIIAGVGVGLLVARRRGMRWGPALDSVAPALPLAQAIGRWGNYFNQELFGRPTEVPWGLEIDPQHRPLDLATFATFHPTFLYEMLWNLALVGLLLLLDKRRVLRPGRLFAVYLGGYFLGRLWVEALRSDEANTIFGLRVNIWTSLFAMGGVLLVLAIGGFRRRPDDTDAPYTDMTLPDAVEELDRADASETPETGEPSETSHDSEPSPSPRPSPTGPVAGTRARAARQRASGGEVSPEGES